jgi:hypothetical protein
MPSWSSAASDWFNNRKNILYCYLYSLKYMYMYLIIKILIQTFTVQKIPDHGEFNVCWCMVAGSCVVDYKSMTKSKVEYKEYFNTFCLLVLKKEFLK